MWRHLSIVVVALKTVVQRVRSNRWRFNFERARTGGQINFLWKTAMIITITSTSILIICPFPRGLLLTYPISPPPINDGGDKFLPLRAHQYPQNLFCWPSSHPGIPAFHTKAAKHFLKMCVCRNQFFWINFQIGKYISTTYDLEDIFFGKLKLI